MTIMGAQQWREAVSALATEAQERHSELNAARRIPVDLYRRTAEQGLFRQLVSTELGGRGVRYGVVRDRSRAGVRRGLVRLGRHPGCGKPGPRGRGWPPSAHPKQSCPMSSERSACPSPAPGPRPRATTGTRRFGVSWRLRHDTQLRPQRKVAPGSISTPVEPIVAPRDGVPIDRQSQTLEFSTEPAIVGGQPRAGSCPEPLTLSARCCASPLTWPEAAPGRRESATRHESGLRR